MYEEMSVANVRKWADAMKIPYEIEKIMATGEDCIVLGGFIGPVSYVYVQRDLETGKLLARLVGGGASWVGTNKVDVREQIDTMQDLVMMNMKVWLVQRKLVAIIKGDWGPQPKEPWRSLMASLDLVESKIVDQPVWQKDPKTGKATKKFVKELIVRPKPPWDTV